MTRREARFAAVGTGFCRRPLVSCVSTTSVTDRSSRRVEAVLGRLEADHGDFAVVEDEWSLPPGEYEWLVGRFERGTVGGAGVWVTNEEGEVLLVRDEDAEGWSEPSGKHEPGETLEETARRELEEETGVTCRLTGVELAQVVTMCTPGAPLLYRLIVVFGGDYREGTVEPAAGEIAEAAWWDHHPPQLRYEALERLAVPAAERD